MPLSKLSHADQAAYLKLVLDSTAEGFYAVDRDMCVTVCNRAFLNLLGYAHTSEVIGRNLQDEIQQGSALSPLAVALSHGASQYIPYELFFRKDGVPLPVEYRVAPITEEGHIKGAICTFTDITARVRGETELEQVRGMVRDTAERINLALDSGMILGTWMWDVKRDILRGDGRFARTFGIDPDQAEKGVPVQLAVKGIHHDDRDRIQALINDALATGGRYDAEYRVYQDGQPIWVHANGRVERDEHGKPARFIGVLSDINERKTIELAYQEIQEQLALAESAGGIGLFTVDIVNNRITTSPGFCRIYGVAEAESYDPTIFENIVLAEDRDIVSNIAGRRDGTSSQEAEYRIRRPSDGEVRWVNRRAAFTFDEHGRPKQMLGAAIDITERKNAEKAMRESQQHLSLMVESARDYAIISLDEQGHVVSWNTGAERIFGHKADAMIGEHFKILFIAEDRAAYVPSFELESAATHGQTADERWHQRADDTRFYASGVTTAMRDESGRIQGFVKIARDMTVQKQIQEDLRIARERAEAANIAKTEFLANMSHEIRTPMNAIIGLSNILGMTQPLTDKQRQFIGILRTSADALLTLINDLLDISKIESGTIDLENIPFSLNRIVDEVSAIMAVRVREKGLAYAANAEQVLGCMFMGDPTRLRQIILNLCANAVKFTETGGVTLDVTNTKRTDGQADLTITVRDTGIGIAPEKRDAIFQKFVQADSSINRKYGGTGLGLTITKTLVDAMGGAISVESEPGQGSVFRVTVTLRPASGSSVTPARATPAAIISTHHVLLVEDYQPNVLVARTLLEEFGYTVDVASDGVEALEKTATGNYACVLMDVQMHRMNGHEATTRIRARERDAGSARRLPIIGMTAHALAGDREQCLAAGMDDYISKPFNPDDLQNKIRRLIAAP